MRKIHFEDNGQDFLWWTLNKEGLVVDCGPFQKSIWEGCKVFDAIVDKYPLVLIGYKKSIVLKHKIIKIEEA